MDISVGVGAQDVYTFGPCCCIGTMVAAIILCWLSGIGGCAAGGGGGICGGASEGQSWASSHAAVIVM